MLNDVVFKCLQSVGVYATEEDLESPMGSIIQDSLMYVSFMVELEQVLGIEIPDELLGGASFNNLRELIDAVSALLPKKGGAEYEEVIAQA